MFSAPEKNIEQLGLVENQLVADFGAGSGAYTLAAARALHNTGRVYAVDVQKDLLDRLQKICAGEHVDNVSFVWGNLEARGGTKLRDASCDVVIISNVLFLAPDKKAAIEEAHRVLREQGRLLLIDWTANYNGLGPTALQVFPEQEARKLAEGSHFTFERAISAGNAHYGLIFRKGLYQPSSIAAAQ